MYKVKLTYFKQSGKYYSEGEYETNKRYMYEILDEVKDLLRDKQLPGLMVGHSDFITLIEVPDHPNNYFQLVVTKG